MSQVTRAYLIVYNGAMLTGWAYIAAQVLRNGITGASLSALYPLIRSVLAVSQTGAVLEVLHAVLKLVRSPVATTALQVLSRVIVLWGAVELGSQKVTDSWFFTQMVTAWSLSEIVRYSFYLCGLVKKDSMPKTLTWLRYSAFAVLYPLGITGEIMCFVNALPFIKSQQPFSVALPNKWNFTFSYYHFVWFTLLGLYPPGSYVMYSYMLNQRKKVLQAKEDAKKSS